MITWTREEVKTRAKAALHMYYWKMVLVGVILSVLVGGGAGGSGSAGNTNQQNSTGSSYESLRDALRGSGFAPDMNNTPGEYDLAFLSMLFKIMMVATIISILVRIFLANPLIAGCRGFYNRIYEEDIDISEVLSVLKGNYWNGVKTCFLRDLYISLWSLLFVIPGIIKSYQYRMVPYILANDPDKDTADVLQESKEMMEGHKMATFVLDLSFLGWIFLGAVTVGLVWIFWTAPYMYATEGALYRKLSNADYGYPGGPQNPYGGGSYPGNSQNPYPGNGSNPNAGGNPGSYYPGNSQKPNAGGNPGSYYLGSAQNPNAGEGSGSYPGNVQSSAPSSQDSSANMQGQEKIQSQFDREYFSGK